MTLTEISSVLEENFDKAISDYDHYQKLGNSLLMHEASAKAGAYSHAKSMLDSYIEDLNSNKMEKPNV